MSPPHLLAPASSDVLSRFAHSNVLLAFDFDGVLAPIVSSTIRARLRAPTVRLLKQVARCYPCVVISGRALADVQSRLGGLPLRAVAGNFGYETSMAPVVRPSRTQAWLPELHARLQAHPGVWIEDKGYSVAVHYRHAPDRPRARRAITAAVRRLAGVRILEGTLATTLLPVRGPHKGSTVQRLRRALGCDRAVYVGDDDTDEDAFVSASPRTLLSVRVGRARSTGAGYRLDHQGDIDALLTELLRIRRST